MLFKFDHLNHEVKDATMMISKNEYDAVKYILIANAKNR